MDSMSKGASMPARRGDLLITGAMTVFPDGTRLADVRVEAGVITEIVAGGGLEHKGGDEVHLDGTGLHLIPGVIDPQVHFRSPRLGCRWQDLPSQAARVRGSALEDR